METSFWRERWTRNEIGFHREAVHPALEKHWPSLDPEPEEPVFVPLCGKSLDMHWLADRGHRVVGVELDERAVSAFFDEAGLSPTVDESGALRRWQAGAFTIFQGDFFEFQAARPFGLVYDRAALVAMPPAMRPGYLGHLAAQLAPGADGLLITFEYPQSCMDGPPFSVSREELADDDRLEFELLERFDALNGHQRFRERGLPWLRECTYRFTVRSR